MSDRQAIALEALIARHWGEVYGCLMALTRRPEVAEELAQDVFLLAWNRGVTPGPELSTWFRRVARNLALNELTRKRPALWSAAELAEVEARDARVVDGPDFEAELTALRRCLSELPEGDRELLEARYARTDSLASLAERTGQTVGYLKQRLFRLRRKLAGAIRARLSGREGEDEQAERAPDPRRSERADRTLLRR